MITDTTCDVCYHLRPCYLVRVDAEAPRTFYVVAVCDRCRVA